MPPKPRSKTKTKSSQLVEKTKKTPIETGESSENATTSGLSQDAEDQIELELCWCIQQLEMCLASGKLRDKQAQDIMKSVNVLKSNTAPLVKKRQVMRHTLGDYRKKMMVDEQKLSRNSSVVKFIDSSKVQNKNSLFLKKAINRSNSEAGTVTTDKTELSVDSSTNSLIKPQDTTFKFNFS